MKLFSENCQWSSWGQWSSCSKTCGTGVSQRKRTIVKYAKHGGNRCGGSSTASQICNLKSCTCQASGTKKGYDSSGPPKDCKFPFKNGHKLYKGCASSSKGAFCATEVSSKGVLTKWARCNEYCDNDEGNVFFLKDI